MKLISLLDVLETAVACYCLCILLIYLSFTFLQVSEFETINGHYSMPEAIHKPVEPVVGDKSNGTSASG